MDEGRDRHAISRTRDASIHSRTRDVDASVLVRELDRRCERKLRVT